MNLRKRIFCLILCLVIFSVSTLTSFAKAENDKANYNLLLRQGFSDNFLKNQTDDYLQKMVDAIGNNEVRNVETTVTKLYDGDVTTMANIDKSLLTLKIEAAMMCRTGSNKVESVLVGVSWEWAANKPTYRGKDAITVNWNSDVFTYADGFYGQDLYKSNAGDEWTVFKDTDAPAEANQGGIGYWTDLKAFKKYVGGAMLFLLVPASPINTGSTYYTGINAEYAHSPVPLTGLSFSVADVGVGLSWNLSCDTLSASQMLRYSR